MERLRYRCSQRRVRPLILRPLILRTAAPKVTPAFGACPSTRLRPRRRGRGINPVPARQHGRRATRGEHLGGFEADPRVRTGDDRSLPGQVRNLGRTHRRLDAVTRQTFVPTIGGCHATCSRSDSACTPRGRGRAATPLAVGPHARPATTGNASARRRSRPSRRCGQPVAEQRRLAETGGRRRGAGMASGSERQGRMSLMPAVHPPELRRRRPTEVTHPARRRSRRR